MSPELLAKARLRVIDGGQADAEPELQLTSHRVV
jgi:hypothetical protein